MTAQQHCPAQCGAINHRFQKLTTHHGVQPAGWLIQNQQLRIMRGCQRQSDFSPLPLTHALDFRDRRHIKIGQQFRVPWSKLVVVECRGKPTDLVSRHPVVQSGRIRNIADRATDLLAGFHAVVPQHGCHAEVRFLKAGQNPNHGRFAGTIFAQQSENNTGWNFQADLIKRLRAAESLRDVLKSDHR